MRPLQLLFSYRRYLKPYKSLLHPFAPRVCFFCSYSSLLLIVLRISPLSATVSSLLSFVTQFYSDKISGVPVQLSTFPLKLLLSPLPPEKIELKVSYDEPQCVPSLIPNFIELSVSPFFAPFVTNKNFPVHFCTENSRDLMRLVRQVPLFQLR